MNHNKYYKQAQRIRIIELLQEIGSRLRTNTQRHLEYQREIKERHNLHGRNVTPIFGTIGVDNISERIARLEELTRTNPLSSQDYERITEILQDSTKLGGPAKALILYEDLIFERIHAQSPYTHSQK